MRQITGTVVFAHPDQLTLSLALSGMGVTVALNQQAVAVWDERDGQGHLAPAGVYQVLVEEKSGADSYFYSENLSLVPSGQPASVALKAAPNVAHPGDLVHLTAAIDGQPANAPAVIKVYTLMGELIRVLPVHGGQADWNLETSSGRSMASGLYLVTLVGLDAEGREVHKSVSLVFIR